MAVQLINSTEVLVISSPNSNIDEDYITDDVIILSQRKYIRRQLGDDLYNELISQYDNNTLTDLNKTLLDDYIKPALGYYILFESLADIHIQLGNQGIRINQDGFSNEGSSADYGLYRDAKRTKGEWYLEEMRSYLKDNATDYPLYDNCEGGRPSNKRFVIY